MNPKDIVHNVKTSPGWAGATISTNTDTDSALVLDSQGCHETICFAVYSGTRTDGSYVLKIMESDDSGGASPSEVSSYQVQDTLATSNAVEKVGAVLTKRYAFLRITSTGTTTGCVFKGAVALQNPIVAPVA